MNAQSTAGLSTQNLFLGYGRNTVVHEVSFACSPGRVMALIGPNGCGKSTILRGVAGLLDQRSRGSILIDGQSAIALPRRALARKLGFMGQQPSRTGSLTVAELVAQGRHPHQGSFARGSAEDARMVNRAIDEVGMGDLRDRPMGELSGGERQRAWFALVLAQDPDCILLDEPTSFLDPAHRVSTINLIRTFAAFGKTMVAVIHDINDALALADEVVAIRNGRIHASGPAAQILTPAVLEPLYDLPWCEIARVEGTPAAGSGPEPESMSSAGGPGSLSATSPNLSGHSIRLVPGFQCFAGEVDSLPAGSMAGPVAANRTRMPGRPGVHEATGAMPVTEIRIVASGLDCGYDGRSLARAPRLDLNGGRLIALIGPSGSGKTTLLKTLAGMIPALGGEFSILAQGSPKQPHDVSLRAYLPQLATIHPDTCVEELASLGRYHRSHWYRQWASQDRESIDAALVACGLMDLRHRRIGELSGGQVQRARIASVLTQEVPLLFLDEPVSYLDPRHQVEVLNLLRSLVDDHGKTVITILHDLWQVSRYADEYLALKNGDLMACGPVGGRGDNAETDTPEESVHRTSTPERMPLGPDLIQQLYGIQAVEVIDPAPVVRSMWTGTLLFPLYRLPTVRNRHPELMQTSAMPQIHPTESPAS